MVASMAWPWEKPTATSTSSWPWDSTKRSKPQPTIDILRRWIKGKETGRNRRYRVLTAAIAGFYSGGLVAILMTSMRHDCVLKRRARHV